MSVPTDHNEVERRFSSQDPAIMSVAAEICNEIASLPPVAGSEVHPHALIVGGFVRDSALGHSPSDVDMQVYGVSPSVLEELLARRFAVRRVGKQYEILKIKISESTSFDVSIPRRGIGDSFTPHEAGDPFLGPRDAARLRDFTINNLAADPLTGRVFDFWGGLEDLRSRTLRITDKDSFVTRGLHVYRAVQFAARMELTADEECGRILREMVASGLPEELTPRIVTDELKKLMLKAKKLSLGLEIMISSGMLERYYPELASLLSDDRSRSAWLAFCDRAHGAGLRLLHTEKERLSCNLAAFLYPLRSAPETLETMVESIFSRLTFAPATVRAAALSLSAIEGIEALYEKSREPPPPPERSSKVVRLPGIARVARPISVREELKTFLDGARPASGVAILALAQAGALDRRVASWLEGQLDRASR